MDGRQSILVILLMVASTSGCTKREMAKSSSVVSFREVSFAAHSFEVADVNHHLSDIQLYYLDARGQRIGTLEKLAQISAASGRRLLFATNAGMFNPDFSPCGLLVQNGVERAPLNLREGEGNFYLKPNGVFFIGRDGAKVVDATKYALVAANVRLATQSGPMLVIDGQIHPKFAQHSNNRRIRSGAGVISPEHVVFVLSREPVTFYEFASLFRDSLRCQNALYLDGDISAFYRSDAPAPQTPREYGVMIGVTTQR